MNLRDEVTNPVLLSALPGSGVKSETRIQGDRPKKPSSFSSQLACLLFFSRHLKDASNWGKQATLPEAWRSR
jgi:hypothetical protein